MVLQTGKTLADKERENAIMKRISILLILALLLCLAPAAQAEDSVQVEVMIADGMSVVMLIPEELQLQANAVFQSAAPNGSESLALPASLTLIEESAFEGIAAQRVEISENVVSIEKRAFADSKSLREIVIPATVLKVDDLALEGCENVTVYGAAGSEAERFAAAAGFDFVDSNAGEAPVDQPAGQMEAPVVLPFVKR